MGLVEYKWGFGRPRGYREGVWKGLGWLRGGWGLRSGPNMGPNLSQVGANLGPCWVQIGSSRPSCSNLEAISKPLGAYTSQDAKMIQISSKFVIKIDKN